jgi:hypothetical protein
MILAAFQEEESTRLPLVTIAVFSEKVQGTNRLVGGEDQFRAAFDRENVILV